MTRQIELFEVGPRDGLQNEAAEISVRDKIALVDLLSQSGLTHIECASFVSPKWVPQMAGSGDVLTGITRKSGIRYCALTPNMRGFEAAQDARADEVAVFASASEGFSRANINIDIAGSLDRFRPVVAAAIAAGVPVRGYVSCVIECPYDGLTAPFQVADVARKLLDMGCYQVSLGDTIGAGTPDSTRAMLDGVLAVAQADQLAGHFHDTHGNALANVAAAYDQGVQVFDTSIGGLGGCPYAPGSAGNVATEGVALWAQGQGIATGLDMAVLARAKALALQIKGVTHV